jgi:AcrR family transcriptional regulator
VLPEKRTSGSRSRGRHRPDLDRDRVLHAAVELVDREGLDALTIRRLGAELGVDAMSIYRHTASKNDLLDGLIDITMAELHLDPGAGDWRAQLHGLADQIRAASRAHPNVFPLLLTRPLSTSLATRPRSVLLITEQTLALLRGAGLDPTSAISCYRRFISWTLGRLLEELRHVVDVPEETDPALRFGLHSLPIAEFPQLRALASTMEGADHAEDELHHGLELLIAAYEPR